MSEFQHNHESLATLLDIMGAVGGSDSARSIAERALDRLHARGLVVAGAVWLRDCDLICLARTGAGPQAAVAE
ncbi:MAG TPA: hypothetical protein VF909_00580, partial [Roseiflexaceae bacterium]